jgi:hypothetical protein
MKTPSHPKLSASSEAKIKKVARRLNCSPEEAKAKLIEFALRLVENGPQMVSSAFGFFPRPRQKIVKKRSSS